MIINTVPSTVQYSFNSNNLYYVYDGVLYKVQSPIIDSLISVCMKSKSCYKYYLINFKEFAKMVGISNTQSKQLLNAFYKVYKKDYYNDINNLEWLLSVLKRLSIYSIVVIKCEEC